MIFRGDRRPAVGRVLQVELAAAGDCVAQRLEHDGIRIVVGIGVGQIGQPFSGPHGAALAKLLEPFLRLEQRFELGWAGAERLIRDCGGLGLANGFIAGAGTDHLAAVHDRDEWVDGVVWQARLIRECGGMPIVLPSVWLATHAQSEADYVDAYSAVAEKYNQTGDLKRYIEYLKLAVRESPQTASLHMKLGKALEEARAYAEALQQWRMVLDLEPDHPGRTRLLNLIKKHLHTLARKNADQTG